MEFKEIDYILTIAECGSLSKAADKLLMTQPSLSQFHDPGRGAHRGRKGFYR